MSPDAIATVIVGAILACLFAIIGFFVQRSITGFAESVAEVKADLVKLSTSQQLQDVAIASLQTAARAMMENQQTVSHSQERIVGRHDELEDVTNQLHDATSALQRRETESEKLIKLLRDEVDKLHPRLVE